MRRKFGECLHSTVGKTQAAIRERMEMVENTYKLAVDGIEFDPIESDGGCWSGSMGGIRVHEFDWSS